MQFIYAFVILLIMWVIFLVFGDNAVAYGIHPRDLSTLKGIFFSSFIHGNFNHIASNSLPLFFLTWLLSMTFKRLWLIIWILITITGGALVWVFGRAGTADFPIYHIGASLTIFALFGFITASGIFRKELKTFFIALVVAVLYGSVIYSGIFDAGPQVSIEGHLLGFIGGFFWGVALRKVRVQKKENVKKKNLPDKLM